MSQSEPTPFAIDILREHVSSLTENEQLQLASMVMGLQTSIAKSSYTIAPDEIYVGIDTITNILQSDIDQSHYVLPVARHALCGAVMAETDVNVAIRKVHFSKRPELCSSCPVHVLCNSPFKAVQA